MNLEGGYGVEKKNLIRFLILTLMLCFVVSCCGRKVPKISVSMHADHPIDQESAFFILREFKVPGDEPEIGGEVLAAMSGTGGAIRGGKGWTDVLTAGHVCMPNPEMVFLDEEFTVYDVNGNFYPGDVIAIQHWGDLCLIRIQFEKNLIPLASKNPTRGDKVYYAGYPAGMYKPGFLHFYDGYYSGVDGSRNGIWSIPAVGGSSGGFVVNRRGELVGVVSAVLTEFHHMTFGATVEQIDSFLKNTTTCTPADPCEL